MRVFNPSSWLVGGRGGVVAALWWLVAGLVPAGAAVTVTLKDGSTLTAESFTPQGANFSVKPAGAGAARVVPAAQIERLEMDPPATLTELHAAFAAGDTTRTLTALGKLRAELDPLKKIPGGREWWAEAEFVRAHVLLGQKRFTDVETSMKEIATLGEASEKRHAAVFLAHLAALNGDPRQGLDQLKALILEARDPETLADAWLFTGQHRAAVNEPHAALLAFLRVPVFYADRSIPLAGARLGAARCFVALEDLASARRTLKELVAAQGATAEGREGKLLLAQVERTLGEAPADPDAPSQ